MALILQKISAFVIMLGSIFFLIAAFLPISMRIFPEPSPARRLAMITVAPTAWFVAQIFFGLGAIVTVLGIGLVGYQVRDRSFGMLVQVSLIVLFIGALLWLWQLYQRIADPAAFAAGALSVWPFVLYKILTDAGLIVFAIALLRSGLPHWVGWLTIGSMALLFVLFVIFRDLPPFVYYLITLLIGAMLYAQGGLI